MKPNRTGERYSIRTRRQADDDWWVRSIPLNLSPKAQQAWARIVDSIDRGHPLDLNPGQRHNPRDLSA